MTNKHVNENTPLQTVWIAKEAHSRGADDPDISRPFLFAKKIAEHLDLSDAGKDEADFFADRLIDKLESALMYYQLIMADDFDERNVSQKRTIYEGLYANLWSFYKGRMQNYLNKMGWKLDFLFCRESNFEKLAEKFIEENPEHKDIVNLAREQRHAWQTDFGHSRDASEHSGDYRDGTDTYENKKDAKRFFAQVCWTAETFIAYFGSYKMEEDWNVIDLDPKSTVFDHKDRHVVEHAVQTMQRDRQNENISK